MSAVFATHKLVLALVSLPITETNLNGATPPSIGCHPPPSQPASQNELPPHHHTYESHPKKKRHSLPLSYCFPQMPPNTTTPQIHTNMNCRCPFPFSSHSVASLLLATLYPVHRNFAYALRILYYRYQMCIA